MARSVANAPSRDRSSPASRRRPRRTPPTPGPSAKPLRLENQSIRVVLDAGTGGLLSLTNRLTGEVYGITGDQFTVEATDFSAGVRDVRLVRSAATEREIRLEYAHPQMAVTVRYSLNPDHHFVEKQLDITPRVPTGVVRVVLAQWRLASRNLAIVRYRHPAFARLEEQPMHQKWNLKREPGTEPVDTFFVRTRRGGLFAGVEMPFASSQLKGRAITLGLSPNLKMAAGQVLKCPPVYLGAYRRSSEDERAAAWRPQDEPRRKGNLPLPSESSAMVAMTSAILGPARHGVVAMACGWHCEFAQHTYSSEEAVDADRRSLDFLHECGVDWLSDSHPWGGETERMNAMTEPADGVPGPLVQRFLDRARELGIGVVQWPTMNCTHPWSNLGRPFRPDRPEWLRKPLVTPEESPGKKFRARVANCLANRPFFEWLVQMNFQALATGLYRAWAMDGDFWGTGAYYDSTVPVDCGSDEHDHLPNDANFACQQALDEWTARVRQAYPEMVIAMCRPPMDLGVWSQRNVDACFTLIETGTGKSNVAGGDEIRTCSRIRVHHHFFPHWLDWPLLFPSYASATHKPDWPSEKIDYIMLSAYSCSPRLLLYLPTKTGIPDADKVEIRKWITWGKRNEAFLMVRKDLFDWPAPDRVDGSAHCISDRGIVFLFNPGQQARTVTFALTENALGLRAKGGLVVRQEYPANRSTQCTHAGSKVTWEVPGETAVILRIDPRER